MKKLFRSLWISLGFLFIQEMTNGEENSALKQQSTQSSLFNDWYPQNSVDGSNESCSQTRSQSDPWWKVDLLREYRVNRVVISNRVTQDEMALDGAMIRIGSFPDDVYSNKICAVISSITPGDKTSFSCGGLVGRYVIIHIPGDQKILMLCEVETYGFIAGNRATDGVPTQSSTYTSTYMSTTYKWIPELAVDGDRGFQLNETVCASTPYQTDPWWRIDLKEYYGVDRVVITNRKDHPARINGAELRIGNSLDNNGNNNPLCAPIPAIPARQSFIYQCNGMEGRYVNIILPGASKMLTLCEVEVYGDPLVKTSFVKLQFRSGADLTDPSTGETVLKQLGSALANRGFTNFTLRWSHSPKKEIQKEKDTGSSVCGKRK